MLRSSESTDSDDLRNRDDELAADLSDVHTSEEE